MVMVKLTQAKDPVKPIDPGLYVVKILGYDETSFTYNNKDIQMYKFKLHVEGAKLDGELLSEDYILDYSVGATLTTHDKNKLYKLLKVLNIDLEVDSNFELDDLVGKKFQVLVSTETKKRKSDGQEYTFPSVADVLPLPKAKKPAAPVSAEKKSTSLPTTPKPKAKDTDPSDEDVDAVLEASIADLED